jgi:L-serine dehydratase
VQAAQLRVSQLMLANERAWRSSEIREGLLHIWSVMRECVDRACATKASCPAG